MAEYNYTCGDCLHVQICEGDPSLRAFDRKNTAYCKAFKNAADVAEVVHCGECIHNYGVKANCEFNPHDIVCDWWSTDGMDETDFCSRGERRSE